jgi:hypothetical protein
MSETEIRAELQRVAVEYSERCIAEYWQTEATR